VGQEPRERNLYDRMTDRDNTTTPYDTVFQWHDQYRGRSVAEVTKELESEISRDQRAYDLALSGAEESEHDALASVVDVDRRWSMYHFGWNEVDPALLARRIADFEWEREQRQEMMSWQDYRDAGTISASRASASRQDWRANMDDTQRRKVANILAGVVVALIVVAIVAVLVLVL
jgi:hypothetical protein